MSDEKPRIPRIEAPGSSGTALAGSGNALGFRGIPLLPGADVSDDKLPTKTMIEKGRMIRGVLA